MSASATIVSFLLIESCRLEPFPKDTTLLTTELLEILLLKTRMSLTIFKAQMTCDVSGKLSY